MALLEVRNLQVAFYTKDGVVKAVNGISYSLDEGDTLGIVGESGCGKSVSALAMLRLLPMPPARIAGGEVVFQGQDLLKLPISQMHTIRGSKIAMIFQDPMTSLNPVMSIGNQISEAVRVNLGLGSAESRKRTIEVLSNVGHPARRRPIKRFSAPVLRRHAPARDDRHGHLVQPQTADRG